MALLRKATGAFRPVLDIAVHNTSLGTSSSDLRLAAEAYVRLTSTLLPIVDLIASGPTPAHLVDNEQLRRHAAHYLREATEAARMARIALTDNLLPRPAEQ